MGFFEEDVTARFSTIVRILYTSLRTKQRQNVDISLYSFMKK